MRPRLLIASTLAVAGTTALTAWLLEWSFEKAALYAPVIVAAFGAGTAVVVLWTRVAWESLRKSRHPRRLVLLTLAVLAVLLALSLLGLKLPRE